MNRNFLLAILFFIPITAVASDAGDPIAQYVTPVKANEKRIIYLYTSPAEYPLCGENKRATAYYKTGEEMEKLAEGCWVEGAGKIAFKLFAVSGQTLMLDINHEEIEFLNKNGT